MFRSSWAGRNWKMFALNSPPFPFSLFPFLPALPCRSLGKVDLEPISLKGRSIKRYIVISVCHHLNQLIYNGIASVGPLKGPCSPLPALGWGRCRRIGLSLLLLPIDRHDMLLMRKSAYVFNRNGQITDYNPDKLLYSYTTATMGIGTHTQDCQKEEAINCTACWRCYLNTNLFFASSCCSTPAPWPHDKCSITVSHASLQTLSAWTMLRSGWGCKSAVSTRQPKSNSNTFWHVMNIRPASKRY